MTIVIYTDGIKNAGERSGQAIDLCTLLEAILEEQEPSTQMIADTILNQAIRLDQGRPNDDMSVVALRVAPDETDQIRRMTLRLPVPSTYSF